jgi:hypothetical protein
MTRISEQDVAGLIERMAEAASAFIQGDMRRYAHLMRHADDFTLLAPSGGEPRRGFDESDEALKALSRYFKGGQSELEVFQTVRPPSIRSLTTGQVRQSEWTE